MNLSSRTRKRLIAAKWLTIGAVTFTGPLAGCYWYEELRRKGLM